MPVAERVTPATNAVLTPPIESVGPTDGKGQGVQVVLRARSDGNGPERGAVRRRAEGEDGALDALLTFVCFCATASNGNPVIQLDRRDALQRAEVEEHPPIRLST